MVTKEELLIERIEQIDATLSILGELRASLVDELEAIKEAL
jgi:hypothetical protein